MTQDVNGVPTAQQVGIASRAVHSVMHHGTAGTKETRGATDRTGEGQERTRNGTQDNNNKVGKHIKAKARLPRRRGHKARDTSTREVAARALRLSRRSISDNMRGFVRASDRRATTDSPTAHGRSVWFRGVKGCPIIMMFITIRFMIL